jgi:hypothetical protein
MVTDLEGSDPGLIEAYPDICLEGFEKTTKTSVRMLSYDRITGEFGGEGGKSHNNEIHNWYYSPNDS